MSSFVYPVLSGLTFDVARQYVWNTGVSRAMSGKRSTIAYMQYPLVHFELSYSILRDDLTPSDLKSVMGLLNADKGQYDTFLFSDPDFNTVANMTFGVTDGVTLTYQITALYENPGGPGQAELIQNFQATPSVYGNRYGVGFWELFSPVGRTNLLLQSQTIDNAVWADANVSITANATAAPDTTVTADVLVETSTSNVAHSISQAITVSSAVTTYTFSAFIRSGHSHAILELSEASGGTQATVWFNNLITGPPSVGTIQTGANWSNVSAVINAVGYSNWYQAQITATKTNAATSVSALVYPAIVDGQKAYVGVVSTFSLYVWGTQLEVGSIATWYLPTIGTQTSQSDYSLGATGLVTFAFTPPANVNLSWSGSFYYRCAFDEDKLDAAKFMTQWWGIKKVPFTSVKL
jgi:hypothetical protein